MRRRLAGELLDDLPMGIDYLVGAVGTGGTLRGTMEELRRLGSTTTSIGVEPAGSIIFGYPPAAYLQTRAGAPAGFEVGPNVDHSLIDEGLIIDDIDAFTAARVVARRTGLLVGGTASTCASARPCPGRAARARRMARTACRRSADRPTGHADRAAYGSEAAVTSITPGPD